MQKELRRVYDTSILLSPLYKNTIWTNHVLDRLRDRNISQDIAWKALQYADKTMPGNKSGTTEFIKHINNHTITTVATLSENREWVVLSCWAHPPFPGSIDIQKKKAYLRYKQSSITGKIWIQIKRAFGFYEKF
ncbi:hypothetical protein BH09PAT2_BH09PAT2_11180 [soil metagenome]